MDKLPQHPDVAAIFSRLLGELKMNSSQFAKRIGTTPQAISNYMVGRNEPGRKIIGLIISAFPGIDAGWLAGDGTGDPFPSGRFNKSSASTPDPARPAASPLRVNTDGESESYWKALAADRLEQLRAATEREKWLQGQFQELVGKSPASAYTAGAAALTARPIGFGQMRLERAA